MESPLRLGWWGGATAVGSGTDATTGASFVTWSDAANADVVLDAADTSFRFYSVQSFSGSGGCLSSNATGARYPDFCLSGGSRIYFNNQTYTVSRVVAKSGACMTALLTFDGFLAEIRTSTTAVVAVVSGNRRPTLCGSS